MRAKRSGEIDRRLDRSPARIAVGAVAGFYGGIVDDALMRVTEAFQTLPNFLLLLVLVAVFGSDITTVTVAIGLVSWPAPARLTRAEFLTLKQREKMSVVKDGLAVTDLIVQNPQLDVGTLVVNNAVANDIHVTGNGTVGGTLVAPVALGNVTVLVTHSADGTIYFDAAGYPGRTLGLPAQRGLMDILIDDKLDFADVMLRTNVDTLSILPAGTSTPRATELLASSTMSNLVTEIAHRRAAVLTKLKKNTPASRWTKYSGPLCPPCSTKTSA